MDTQWPYVIRRQRLLRRLTQQQLADAAGVSRKTIAALESVAQQEPVSLTVLTRVASVFGLIVTLAPEPSPFLKSEAGNDAALKAHHKRVRPRNLPAPTGPLKPANDLQGMTLQQAFSKNTAACLDGHFGRHIGLPELLTYDRAALRRIPNIGRTRINEIEQFFAEYGLQLGEDIR